MTAGCAPATRGSGGVRRLAALALLLAAGTAACGSCDSKVHVDRSYVGPSDGSRARPFRTIQEGLAATDFGETVVVAPGTYSERVTMRRNSRLQGAAGVAIVGSGNLPTITAPGNNTIADVIVLGGGTGILLGWDGIGREEVETSFTVARCQVRDADRGIEFTTPDQLAFDADEEVSVRLNLHDNWLRGLVGDAVRVDLRGPTAGTVTVQLDVHDNAIHSNGFAAVHLKADERRSSEGQLPSARILGEVRNNLLVLNRLGLLLSAASRSAVSPRIVHNTIARNTLHGVDAAVDDGAFGAGNGVIGVTLERNILADNAGFGYQEFTAQASAILLNNLFSGNALGQYADFDGNVAVNGQDALNGLGQASGNLVGDPRFVRGSAPILGSLDNTQPGPGDFFLQQGGGGTASAALDAGTVPVADARLQGKTTNTTHGPDVGNVDLGFHFTPPGG